MPESCRHLTASHAHSHPCLVSLLFIPSLFTCLLSFFLHTCAEVLTIIEHNYARFGGKSTQHRQLIGINDIYKFLFPKAVYKLVISENLS